MAKPAHRSASLADIPSVNPDWAPGWKSVRHHLGVTAFGVNAIAANAGELVVEPHSEADTGDEEVYLVLRGGIELAVDGSIVALGEGGVAAVDPPAYRRAAATMDGTLVVAAGARPGEPFVPAFWDQPGGGQAAPEPDPARKGASDGVRSAHLHEISSSWDGGPTGWRSIRRALRIRSFGVNAVVADTGDELIASHDESESAHQELYLVSRGTAAFTIGPDAVELGPLQALVVEPQATRAATALEDETVLYAFGAPVGRPYELYWDGA